MSQVYKIEELENNLAFQIQMKTCFKNFPKQCLTAIIVEGIHILDFSNCLPENDNIFIYQDNKIRLYRDPSMILTWDTDNELLVLSKEDIGFQTITIGYLENTNFPVIYLGTNKYVDASSYVLTMYPRGLGFYPMNFDHLLPLQLKQACKRDLEINKNSKEHDKKVRRDFLINNIDNRITNDTDFNNVTEGFGQLKTDNCIYYFIILIIILVIVYYNDRPRK